jgi:hypothetical protein
MLLSKCEFILVAKSPSKMLNLDNIFKNKHLAEFLHIFFTCSFFEGEGHVLDLVSQVCDVVLIKCIFGSGRPQGVGILE